MMSKQRKKHPAIVSHAKHCRKTKKGLSNPFNFAEYLSLNMRWQNFSSKYHGTQFRGMKRWK